MCSFLQNIDKANFKMLIRSQLIFLSARHCIGPPVYFHLFSASYLPFEISPVLNMIFPIRRKKWKYGTPRWITSNCMKFQNWPCSSGSGTQWNMKHFDEIRCESISGNPSFFKWRQLNCYESFKTYVTFCPVCIIFLCTDAFILHSNQTYNGGGGPMLKEGTPDWHMCHGPKCTNKDDNAVSVLGGQGTGGMLSIHYPRSRLLSTQLRSA